MGGASSIIETGVDRLVNLVRQKGRISAVDASKIINVGTSVIMEWAEFLEEEGIISIEYTLTQPFLVERKLTKQQVQQKAKEFDKQKDVFVRKAEISARVLEEHAQYLESVKKEFDEISKKFSIESSIIKKELGELISYEGMRHKLTEELRNQKEESKNNITKLAQKLGEEQKKIQNLMEDLFKEEEKIKKEKIEAESIEQTEKEAYRKIEELKQLVNNLEKKSKSGDDSIRISKGRLDGIKKMISDVKNEIEEEKKIVVELMEKGKEHEEKIERSQQEILKKIDENEEKMRNAREFAAKLKDIFEKKASATGIFDTMVKNNNELRQELDELIKKAKSFQLSSKKDIGKHIGEIEGKFEEVNKKKDAFEEMYKKLINVIRK